MTVRVRWMVGSLSIAAAVVLAAFVGGVFALRAFAQPVDGVIYACVGERSGALRLVDGPDDCLRGEEPIEWNVTGPQGLEGPVGPPGSPAIFSLERVTNGPLTVGAGASLSNVARCPIGFTALSGGVQVVDGSISDLAISQSFGIQRTWHISVVNSSVGAIDVTLSALCTETPPD